MQYALLSVDAWSSCGGLMFQEIADLKGDKKNLEEEIKKLKE